MCVTSNFFLPIYYSWAVLAKMLPLPVTKTNTQSHTVMNHPVETRIKIITARKRGKEE